MAAAASSFALVVAVMATSVGASSFLKQLEKGAVEGALLSELMGQKNSARIRDIEAELRPMYASLPQSQHGTLDPSTVRYALHRYFVKKHSWYVRGLDPAGGSLASSPDASIMKDRAPSYILGLFTEHLGGQGFGIHELAVFAATLSDLIRTEAAAGVEDVFDAMKLDIEDQLTRSQADQVAKHVLVAMFFPAVTAADPEELAKLEAAIREMIPDWDATNMWVQDFGQSYDLAVQSRRNPFAEHRFSFEEVIDFVRDLSYHFGSFQNLECLTLKQRLVEMEHQGTGRIPLSRFYAKGLEENDFSFSESEDYLRMLGALDETGSGKSVIISNYILSQANCLTTSGFFALCCSSECEDLLAHVEEQIGHPEATPMRIAEVVSGLSSDSVVAPRNLSVYLATRLEDIAKYHAGTVPVHGRLFAQWMHHAYPLECPFPHVAGSTQAISQHEWIERYGADTLDATEEEMDMYANTQEDNLESNEAAALPWIAVEELVAQRTKRPQAQDTHLRKCMSFALLGSLLVFLFRSLSLILHTRDRVSGSKGDKYLV